MGILTWTLVACGAILLGCFFMASVLPRLWCAYYVEGRAGVQIGPFFTRRSAERYARRRGLAGIDPALPATGGRVHGPH